MLDINLLPGESLVKKGQTGKFLSWVLTYGRYIIIGTELVVLLAFFSRFKIDRDLTDLHDAISQKEAVVIASQDFEKQIRSLQTKLNLIKDLLSFRSAPKNLLDNLSELTPTDVFLSDLVFEQKRLTLSATALNNESLNTFLNNLSFSDSFEEVSLDAIGKNQNGAGVEFRISAKIKELYGK